ncbi:MAG: PEP-CTERM sorting domain-containing protein [Burkholderiaceae bacterium]|nr:MAG: PEP-CTERM sorting domain-containing protein [Burkholderiaceae bacterium]
MKISKYLASLVVFGTAFTPLASHAAIINSLFSPGINEVQDSDAERVLREGRVITSGSLAVGDVIQSILRFDTANGGFISDTLGPPYQLTGYSELRIAAIVSGTGPGGLFDTLFFAPTGSANMGLDPRAMVRIYERTTALQPSFNLNVAPATGIANVFGQTFLASFGFGEVGDYWFSTVLTGTTIDAIASSSAGQGQSPNGVFGLSTLDNPGGLPIADDGILSPISLLMHDIVGDTSIFARENRVDSGWLVSSNINASFAVVPAPNTSALLGLALVGMFMLRRRKQS